MISLTTSMTETHRGVFGPNTLYVIVFITRKFHVEAISRHGDNDPERERSDLGEWEKS